MPESQAARILVVNDDAPILELMRDLLEAEGYTVETAMDPGTAYTEAKRWRPDLLILDLLLGREASGLQAVETLVLDPDTRGLKILIYTANLQLIREHEDHWGRYGIRALVKPFGVDELLEAVASTLASRP